MTLPRQRPKNNEERQKVTDTRYRRGTLGGRTRNVLPTSGDIRPMVRALREAGIIVVIHNSDPTVARQGPGIHWWVGSATPDNGYPWEPWYDEDVEI